MGVPEVLLQGDMCRSLDFEDVKAPLSLLSEFCTNSFPSRPSLQSPGVLNALGEKRLIPFGVPVKPFLPAVTQSRFLCPRVAHRSRDKAGVGGLGEGRQVCVADGRAFPSLVFS